ncbi:hypothetical protein [Clostridium botulinum]|uniref:Uncharacterized protein n=1 Tax=Clostridium botulinum TaxID=1491 RepID=A0A1L7JNL3_CLOBO|nr:hypothetical protein [Clostridium botulinum]APU87274.1 hypothetical protein NPD8_4060 [Clostridium botulinum]
MIEIRTNVGNTKVEHKCENEEQIAEELIRAIDIICADMHVNNTMLTYEEKIKKAIASRNNILNLMSKSEYTCEEYFED